jgi:ABC-2 type transport system permease protein
MRRLLERRTLLQGVSGVLTGLFALGLGMLAYDIRFPHVSVGWALLALLITATSLSGLGLLLANLSLVGTNPNLVVNIVFYGLILITGANVPLSDLPGPLAAIGNAVPMTHGLAAMRAALSGQLSAVPGQLGWELLVGAGYAAAGIGVFRYAEWHARRVGSLDLV